MIFGKLVAMLAQAKGGAVAAVFIASGMTATVAVSNSPEAQQTIQNVTESVSQTLATVTNVNGKPCVGNPDGGQPEIVAQRNAANKLLRDAWNEDHKKLNALRKDGEADNKSMNDLIKTYQVQLKDRLDEALTDVAALTFGREGKVNKAPSDGSGSASPADGTVAAGSKSPKPSCTPKPSPTGAAAPTDGSAAAAPSDGTASGRVKVANRTTLNADLKTIVEEAVKDMDDLVKKAADEAATLPASERGKPEDKEKEDEEKGKPSDKPGNGKEKPSASPRA